MSNYHIYSSEDVMGASATRVYEAEAKENLLDIIRDHIPIEPGSYHEGLSEEFDIEDTGELLNYSVAQLEKIANWVTETFPSGY